MWNKLRARHYSILILGAIVALETSAIAIDRFLTRPNNTAFEVVGQFKNNAFIEHFQQAEAKSQPAPVNFSKFSPLLKAVQAASIAPAENTAGSRVAFAPLVTKPAEAKLAIVRVDPDRWVDYAVGKGDSLAVIAGNYGVSVDSLKSANGIADGTNLKAGQKIKVPFSAPKLAYTVKSGDTLSRIASRFGLPLQELIRANELKQDSLSLGQKIELPVRVQGKNLEIARTEASKPVTPTTPVLEKISSDKPGQTKLTLEKGKALQMVSAPSAATKPSLTIAKADLEKKVVTDSKPVVAAKPAADKPAMVTAPVPTVLVAAAPVSAKPAPVVEVQKPVTPKPLPITVVTKPTVVVMKPAAVVANTDKMAADSEMKLVPHTVKTGENLASLARQYKTSISQIVAGNQALNGHDLKPGQQIQIPVSKKFYRVLQVTTKRAEVSTRFCMPVRGSMSDPYGWRMHPVYHRRLFHAGVDLAAPRGTPIMAAQAGTVIYSGWLQGYGKLVVIRHPNGFSTRYGHCSSIRVSTGQTVRSGQIIGGVGATGTATGNHLHFEVRRNGSLMNPMTALSR